VTQPRRAGDPPRLIASASKAREILGWRPQFDRIEDIVSSAWNWHLRHPNGYGD
jgi:UDP-glucose 4-epimerase